MDNTLDDLHEKFFCHSIADVKQMQEEFEAWKGGRLQEANETYDKLNGITTQMAELGSTENPYTTLTPEVTGVRVLCRLWIIEVQYSSFALLALP